MPMQTQTQKPSSSDRRLLRGIMAAVAVWGLLLALGTALFGVDPETGQVTFAPNLARGIIVFGCVAAFLGIWLLALRRRRA